MSMKYREHQSAITIFILTITTKHQYGYKRVAHKLLLWVYKQLSQYLFFWNFSQIYFEKILIFLVITNR